MELISGPVPEGGFQEGRYGIGQGWRRWQDVVSGDGAADYVVANPALGDECGRKRKASEGELMGGRSVRDIGSRADGR